MVGCLNFYHWPVTFEQKYWTKIQLNKYLLPNDTTKQWYYWTVVNWNVSFENCTIEQPNNWTTIYLTSELLTKVISNNCKDIFKQYNYWTIFKLHNKKLNTLPLNLNEFGQCVVVQLELFKKSVGKMDIGGYVAAVHADVQGDPSGGKPWLGWLRFGEFPRLVATTVATYCPGRMVDVITWK